MAMRQISSDWEALIPEDRVTVRYQEAEGSEVLDGATADRRFAWGPPQPIGTVATTGDADLVEWTIVAVCRLNNIGRTRRERSGATSAEAQSLISTAINRTVWPDGIQDVQQGAPSIEYLDGGSGALVTLPFRVLSVETTAYAYGPVVEIDPQGESEIVFIEPDPDLVVGDGEVEIGAVALTVGTYEWSQAVWSDTATADATTVTVRLRDEGGAEIASIATGATVATTLVENITITDVGIYTLTIQCASFLGVGRVGTATFTREIA